ncbi:MAG: TerC family protein [Planctomycetes bacterium]|nr:TerC family protein [Planctomycetota bacterium]
MTRRPFPWFVFSMGVAVTLFALLRPALAQPPAGGGSVKSDDAAEFPAVKIQPVSGSPDEGTLKLSAVTVETATGTVTVRMKHVKQIAIHTDPEGKAHDVVTLTDKSKVSGRVTAEQFVVAKKGGGSESTWKKADVREIKIERDEQLPLIAILLGLLTLTAMEIVLGVDNIIFIAIVAGKLPKEQQARARRIGLLAALGTRLALLGSLFLLLGLTSPLFTLPTFGVLTDIEAREVSFRDLILLLGGLFLIGKSTFEIHEKLEHAKKHHEEKAPAPAKPVSFAWTIFTIAVIDIVFSLDSVITAIGMVEQLWVMIVAVILAMMVMLYFAGPIANFVDRHPTVKVLALAFLILIGVMLVAEGLGQHMDKGYIYVAMSFSLVVEFVNMKIRGPKKPKTETGSPDGAAPPAAAH